MVSCVSIKAISEFFSFGSGEHHKLIERHMRYLLTRPFPQRVLNRAMTETKLPANEEVSRYKEELGL